MRHLIDPANQTDLLNAVLRQDLNAFVEKVFKTLSPGDDFCPNWHIDAITHALRQNTHIAGTDATQPEPNSPGRLIITQPPRSLKSITASVAFVAWALGHNPSLEFICVSYSSDLALTLSRQFRLVIEAEWYRNLFPRMQIKRLTDEEVRTTKGGGRLATSIGGTLTGRGADIIIIDDPLKAEQAHSATARKAVIDWYSSSLVSRLNDKRKGSIILVMQRLHEEDLAGHLLEQGGCQHLDLPAIAIEDQAVLIGPGPFDVHKRKAGDVLHPEREPATALEQIKRDLGSIAFSAQYQQRPIPIEGNLVKRKWIRSYSSVPDAPGTPQVIQSWDIAGSITDTADFSVCTTWQKLGNDHYLLDVWRGRLQYPALRHKVIEMQGTYKARTILLEKDGLGLSLYQDLRSNGPRGFPAPIGINAVGDKIVRLEAQSSKFEAGTIYLPEDPSWLDIFLRELLAFPSSKHDDQVDSVSQYLNWVDRSHNRKRRIGAPKAIMRDPIDSTYY